MVDNSYFIKILEFHSNKPVIQGVFLKSYEHIFKKSKNEDYLNFFYLYVGKYLYE